MIKSLTPPTQKFSELPSEVFFLVVGERGTLYQKKLLRDDNNSIVLVETSSGQRSHNYKLGVTSIKADVEVQRIDVVDIEVLIAPKSVNV